MLSVRDPIRRRQPVERPLDIVALELLVSVSQALLVGILLSLATQLGGDARAAGLPIPGLLAILGIAVGAGWVRWLMGGSGAIMASVCLATSILAGALWLLSLQDPTLPRIDPLVGLIAVACAIYGLVAGVFLDGPHRAHWKGGISEPRRGVVETRATPARFSPPVQKVVDERLTDLHLPKVSLPSMPTVTMPAVKRPGRTDGTDAAPAPGDGLAIAATVTPQPAAPTEEADARVVGTEAQATDASSTAAVVVPEPASVVAEAPAEAAVAEAPTEVVPAALAAPAPAAPTVEPAPDPVGDPAPPDTADPDAPTEPVARPAAQWPRPIEPRGHTGAHKVDPGT